MKRLAIVFAMTVSAVCFAGDAKWTVLPTAQNALACAEAVMPNPRADTWISACLVCSEKREGKTVELFRSNHLTLHVRKNDAMRLHVDPSIRVGSISSGRARMTFVLPEEIVVPPKKEWTLANRINEWSGDKFIVYRFNDLEFFFVVENKNNPDGPVEAALYNPPIEKPKQNKEQELPTKP